MGLGDGQVQLLRQGCHLLHPLLPVVVPQTEKRLPRVGHVQVHRVKAYGLQAFHGIQNGKIGHIIGTKGDQIG